MKKVLSVAIVVVLLGSLFTGCKEKQEGFEVAREEAAAEEKTLAGKRVVMIIAPQNFRDEELFEPKQLLAEKGAEVKIASASLEIAGGMLGAEIQPDVLISDIDPDQWDAIILIGGTGASRYWEDTSVHSLLNEAVKQNKIVGAICIAPVTLANAGILSGKRATVHVSERQKLTDKGADCTLKDVQRDGNIITASGPPAAKGFGEAIAEALAE